MLLRICSVSHDAASMIMRLSDCRPSAAAASRYRFSAWPSHTVQGFDPLPCLQVYSSIHSLKSRVSNRMQELVQSMSSENAPSVGSGGGGGGGDGAQHIMTSPASGPSPTGGAAGPLVLSEPTDPLYLTSLICLVRRQLEFYVATEEDEKNRRAKGGVKKPIVPGRVGIRCIHCRHLPVKERAKNFSSFPTSIRLVNQAVRNYQRYHLPHCQAIPPEVMAEYEQCKKDSRIIPKGPTTARKITHMEYWEECCYKRGLVDNGDNGIKFASDADVAGAARTLNGSGGGGGGAGAGVVTNGTSNGAAQAPVAVATVAAAAAARPSSASASYHQTASNGIQVQTALDAHVGNAFDALLLGDEFQDGTGGSPWEPDPLPPSPSVFANKPASNPIMMPPPVNGVLAVSPIPERMPVKDWINKEMILAMTLHGSQVQDADRSYQLKAANLALAILDTVNVYHQNRIAFGDTTINSNDILVSSNEEVGKGATCTRTATSSTKYSVLFSGYNMSQSPPSSATFEGDSRTDLTNIGAVLYEMFAGIPPFQNQDNDSESTLMDSLMQVNDEEEDPDWGPTTKKKRGRAATTTTREYIPLRDLGLPVAIDALVTELMNAASQDDVAHGRYKCSADVIADVKQMVNDPDRFLFDIEDDDTIGDRYQWAQDGYRLTFPDGKLYGRDAITDQLMSAFDRTICKGGSVEAVTVSGYSGIGKTSLVLQLRQPTIARGGFFISGKFDTLRQARPLSAIASALNAFCEELVSRQHSDVGTFIATRNAIQEALGDDSGAIVKLIPNLCKIIPLKPDANKVQLRRRSSLDDDDAVDNVDTEIDAKAVNRFMFLFRKFFRAIASTLHPVVLFIDDLQWADAMSLDLIRSIVCQSDAYSFIFVGSYRSNEVDQDHPLMPHLGQIRTAGVPLLNIELANMDRNSINALISDTLKLSPLLTRPLADSVYAKTSGNCLFVIELLSDLHRQGLLQYSVSSRRWEWDDEAIAALDIQANVVDLMRRKLLRLGATEMWSVKVAACLGAETKASTLDLLSFGLGLTPENGLVALLRRPLEEGLLMKVGSSYRFSHDQIQQAAYSLVSIGDRPSFHLRLGQSLLKAFTAISDGENDDVLFTCVDQLNRGFSEMVGRKEKLEGAHLNLQAAKKSIASSTFLAASIYLRFALGYLDESDWENNYSLCLEIYTTLSETEYVTGKYEEMTMVLNEIFARARTFDDKLRAYYTLTSATAAQNDLTGSVRIAFEVLEQLGEPFALEVERSLAVKDFLVTKSMLQERDKDWFTKQRAQTDHEKLFAMKFLCLITLYAFMVDQSLFCTVSCRMIELTTKYGPCKESAVAFSSHGMLCCALLGDYSEGYRVGKIGTAILSEFNADDLYARCCYQIYGWLVETQNLPLFVNEYQR